VQVYSGWWPRAAGLLAAAPPAVDVPVACDAIPFGHRSIVRLRPHVSLLLEVSLDRLDRLDRLVAACFHADKCIGARKRGTIQGRVSVAAAFCQARLRPRAAPSGACRVTRRRCRPARAWLALRLAEDAPAGVPFVGAGPAAAVAGDDDGGARAVEAGDEVGDRVIALAAGGAAALEGAAIGHEQQELGPGGLVRGAVCDRLSEVSSWCSALVSLRRVGIVAGSSLSSGKVVSPG
jgi:hypothetical protein